MKKKLAICRFFGEGKRLPHISPHEIRLAFTLPRRKWGGRKGGRGK